MATGIKYTTAYSTDLGQSVAADDAYSYRSQGLISAPDAFVCDSDGCDAKMICVNIDKLPDVRKREPHFRTASTTETHNPTRCSYHQEHAQTDVEYEDKEKKFTNRVKRSGADIIFLEIAPPQPPRQSSDPAHPHVQFAKGRSNGSISGKPSSPNTTRYSRIRSLVSRFLKIDPEFTKDYFVQIGDRRLSYADLFFSLNAPDQVLPTDMKRIFYGMGYIDPIGNSKWKMAFNYKQELEGVSSRPSIFVSAEEVDAYYEKSLMTQVIDKCLDSDGRKIDLYIYAAPILSRDRKFINMPTAALDHLYFFPRNYLGED